MNLAPKRELKRAGGEQVKPLGATPKLEDLLHQMLRKVGYPDLIRVSMLNHVYNNASAGLSWDNPCRWIEPPVATQDCGFNGEAQTSRALQNH